MKAPRVKFGTIQKVKNYNAHVQRYNFPYDFQLIKI